MRGRAAAGPRRDDHFADPAPAECTVEPVPLRDEVDRAWGGEKGDGAEWH